MISIIFVLKMKNFPDSIKQFKHFFIYAASAFRLVAVDPSLLEVTVGKRFEQSAWLALQGLQLQNG
ncbi:hypothetical protein HA44_01700 [Mixta gaviniae]|nr:hypothetical protein HA44_01700 [Mixta gaviniae]